MIAVGAGPDPTRPALPVAIVAPKARLSHCLLLSSFFFSVFFFLSSFLLPHHTRYKQHRASLNSGNISAAKRAKATADPLLAIPQPSRIAKQMCQTLSLTSYRCRHPPSWLGTTWLGRARAWLPRCGRQCGLAIAATGCLRPLASLKIQYRAKTHHTPHAPRRQAPSAMASSPLALSRSLILIPVQERARLGPTRRRHSEAETALEGGCPAAT